MGPMQKQVHSQQQEHIRSTLLPGSCDEKQKQSDEMGRQRVVLRMPYLGSWVVADQGRRHSQLELGLIG